MSISSFSSVLSSTIISVKYVNDSLWRQKSQFAYQLKKGENEKSHSTIELNEKTQKIGSNLKQKYPDNYLIDTYA